MEQFWTVFWGAIGAIVTGLITWLFSLLKGWIASKIKDQKLKNFLLGFTTILESSVDTISQTVVDDLKKEKQFSAEKAAEAKDMCIEMVMAQLVPDSKQYIQDNFGDVKEFVSSHIESYLHKQKR